MNKLLRCARTWSLKFYWLLPVLFLVAFLTCFVLYFFGWYLSGMDEKAQRNWLTLMPLVLGWTYFFQKQKLEEDKLFLELFENYNKRFYELSEDLNNLDDALDCSENLTPVVHKYFDLCIEQYQLYERGRIPENIWRYWVVGMNRLLKKPPIRQYWETMEKNGLSSKLTIDYIESLASQSKSLD